MTEVTCPNCGATVPPEAGQHALSPTSGLVACPTCGENVILPKEGAGEPEGSESESEFEGRTEESSVHDTLGGVMDELSEKEGGPQ